MQTEWKVELEFGAVSAGGEKAKRKHEYRRSELHTSLLTIRITGYSRLLNAIKENFAPALSLDLQHGTHVIAKHIIFNVKKTGVMLPSLVMPLT